MRAGDCMRFTRVGAMIHRHLRGAFGEVVIFTVPAPYRGEDEVSEDGAIALWTGRALLLGVADGVGGSPGGAAAASVAIDTLASTVAPDRPIAASVLSAFETADRVARSARGIGMTTLLVAEIADRRLQLYNAGDSEAIVVGGRGRVKLRTVVHSPVGYQVAAGVLGRAEALHHEARHVISNVVGSPGLRVEVGPRLSLKPRDTVALATDGLFDNVTERDLSTHLKSADLAAGAADLFALARRRMLDPADGEPSKPDDIALIAFRGP